MAKYIRFACFIAIIAIASLARGDRGIINELEEVLSVTSYDGQLFRVLTDSIELVSESRL